MSILVQQLPFSAIELQQIVRRTAALDIIFCEEAWLRLHSYRQGVGEAEAIGWIDNGAGDSLHAVFGPAGVLIKGFDHESPISPYAQNDEPWPGMYEKVPAELAVYLEDVALEKDDVTFCYWQQRQIADRFTWHSGALANVEQLPEGDRDGGASFLLGYLPGKVEDYLSWAQHYYGLSEPINYDAAAAIYEGEEVTAELIHILQPKRNSAQALAELKQLGGLCQG